MAYNTDNARFSILDMIPCDVWQEPTTHDHGSDPDKYLCIVGEEPADYHGNFFACVYSEALYQREHVGVASWYLEKCTPAPEPIARAILAHYLRQWARLEDQETADLLREEAEDLVTA